MAAPLPLVCATLAGASLARRLIDVYFTIFKMVLDGKIGTAAQVRWGAGGRGWGSLGGGGDWTGPAAVLQSTHACVARPAHRRGSCSVRCCPSFARLPTCVPRLRRPLWPGPQLSKQQADKAAAEAARKKKGEAAKAKAAEAARAAAAEAAGNDASGEMDGRMLSALITGAGPRGLGWWSLREPGAEEDG